MRMLWVRLIGSTLMLIAAHAGAQAQEEAGQIPTSDDTHEQTVAGHGNFSAAYLGSYADNFWITSNNKFPAGAVHSRGVEFDASYNVSNAWSVFGGIRYIANRYSGNMPDCPTITPPECAGVPALDPQHPETPFLDDDKYHGTWQDFTFGTAWHTTIGSYDITPSATATIPSHDYPFYGNAYVGQRLKQLLLDVTLSHQFDFTDFYYKLGYGYAFSQQVMGIDTGYQRFDGEIGWFVKQNFSVRTFVTGRKGNGLSARVALATTNFADEEWYRRNQTSQHNYHAYGLGFDYGFGERYNASFSIQHEFWGDTVFDFKYALEARLTRSF